MAQLKAHVRRILRWRDISDNPTVRHLTPDRLGQFDGALFLGVFYHLVDPIRALQNLAALTKEVTVMETHLDLRGLERPAMVFYPETELNDDPTNW